MRLVVTGASSFVGAHFCRLAGHRHDVFGLVHSTPLRLNRVTPVRVDLRRRREVDRIIAIKPDAIVHIACKIKASSTGDQTPAEAAAGINRQMMDAVLAAGCPVVYASSTVVHWSNDTPYARARRDDEARLAASGLPYTILRPSAPYGPPLPGHQPKHRESFHTLAALIRATRVVPIIGSGEYRRQPIHVDDFSGAILALLERGLRQEAFDAGGADALSFNDIIDTMARAMGRRVFKLRLPKALFVQAARFSPDFDPSLIAAVDEDELADPGPLAAATGFTPRTFAAGAQDLI